MRPVTQPIRPDPPGLSDSDFTLREFPLTEADFARIARIMATECGIILDLGKMSLVYSRLANRLRTLHMRTFRQYCAFVASEAGAAERRLMVEALTTNVTRFFREKHHFEHLREKVLPGLIEDARRGGRVRLWSAGCSSGEEPYSIGLTLLEAMPDAARFDIRILATDIDTQVLARGRAGLYPAASVAPVDRRLRETFMQERPDAHGGSNWAVGPELRSLVAFKPANLVDETWPMRGPFQTIFCRNVVIYFDIETRLRVLGKLAGLLSPGGHIYVGHAERLPADSTDFRLVGLTAYQRADPAPVRTGGDRNAADNVYQEHR